MLQSMRNNLKSLSWILWLVVIALSVYVFANWGAQGQLGAPTSVVAWVDGEEILYKEFVEQYRSLDDRYRQMYGNQYSQEMAKVLGVPRQALDSLINTRITLREADRLGIHVSQEEVKNRILELPVFKDEKGQFVGKDKYRRFLEGYGQRVQEFEEGMANDIVASKLGDLIASSVVVTPEEVERVYRERNESIGFDYVTFMPANYLETAKAAITDEEARAYYDEDSEQFRTPLKRRIDYVRLTPTEFRDRVELEEGSVAAYYDENLDKYTEEEQVRASHILIGTMGEDALSPEAAKAKAEDVIRQLKAGADFAALAKDVSTDKGSAVSGGDLGFFPQRGRMVEPFADAAFALKVDEISEPVETQFGYHIIKVTDRKERTVRTLEEVKEEIANQLKLEKASELVTEYAQAFAEKAGAMKDLRAAAEEDGYTAVDAGFIENIDNARIKGLGIVRDVTAMTFSLNVKDISEVVTVGMNKIVFQVMEESVPHVPEFEEIREQVVNRMAEERSLTEARKAADEFRSRVKPGTFASEAEKANMVIGSQAAVTRNTAPANFVVNKARADFEKLFTYGVDQITEPLVSRDDNLLVCLVTEKKAFDPQAFAAEANNLKLNEERTRSNELFTAMVKNARARLTEAGKIEIREDFLTSLEQ